VLGDIDEGSEDDKGTGEGLEGDFDRADRGLEGTTFTRLNETTGHAEDFFLAGTETVRAGVGTAETEAGVTIAIKFVVFDSEDGFEGRTTFKELSNAIGVAREDFFSRVGTGVRVAFGIEAFSFCAWHNKELST
jgi:hypothetical protein